MSNVDSPDDRGSATAGGKLVLTDAHRIGAQRDDAPASEPDMPLSSRVDAVQVDDNAALRAMVAEIVREELRGPLGERMTRNLRKLVRREIARALTMRDVGSGS